MFPKLISHGYDKLVLTYSGRAQFGNTTWAYASVLAALRPGAAPDSRYILNTQDVLGSVNLAGSQLDMKFIGEKGWDVYFMARLNGKFVVVVYIDKMRTRGTKPEVTIHVNHLAFNHATGRQVVDEIRQWVHRHLYPNAVLEYIPLLEKVSKAHIRQDVAVISGSILDIGWANSTHFFTRLKNRHDYFDRVSGRMTGYRVGNLLRIGFTLYDKGLERFKKGYLAQQIVDWRYPGLYANASGMLYIGPDQIIVYRTEWKVGREYLHRNGIRNFDDLDQALTQLVLSWFNQTVVMRAPRKACKRHGVTPTCANGRYPILPLWDWLASPQQYINHLWLATSGQVRYTAVLYVAASELREVECFGEHCAR